MERQVRALLGLIERESELNFTVENTRCVKEKSQLIRRQRKVIVNTRRFAARIHDNIDRLTGDELEALDSLLEKMETQ